ncbi:endonuclease/exonuclease/phosphatase family protein [Pseudomonas syringae pv. aptata]|nr:endonuclease/exonuclease/phosphatase family protein [Pseudomonas syringae]MCK0548116.1 endonuclease/exonuclease/phosphatase family protein [Pseudomonas syringae pv. aptata]
MTSANPPVGPATPVSASVSLNVLTMNMHMGFGIFNRRFILPELREAVRTVSADIVFLQEVHGEQQSHARKVKDWPTISQYEFLADSMWSDFAYGRNAVYPDGDHGNALLSKYPIIQHENLDISIHGTEQRGLLHCILEVPHAGRVHAVCVHLGLRESHRRQQLKLLNELMARIPEGEPVIVAGDFNDWRRAPMHRCRAAGCMRFSSSASGHRPKAFRPVGPCSAWTGSMSAMRRRTGRKCCPAGRGPTFPIMHRWRWS